MGVNPADISIRVAAFPEACDNLRGDQAARASVADALISEGLYQVSISLRAWIPPIKRSHVNVNLRLINSGLPWHLANVLHAFESGHEG